MAHANQLHTKVKNANNWKSSELLKLFQNKDKHYHYLIIEWEDEVLGPGGIWGRVQGVGSDPWGTNSQPSMRLHPRAARMRAKRAF